LRKTNPIFADKIRLACNIIARIVALGSLTNPVILTTIRINCAVKFHCIIKAAFSISAAQTLHPQAFINASIIDAQLPIVRAHFVICAASLCTKVVEIFIIFLAYERCLNTGLIEIINNTFIFASLALFMEVYSAAILSNSTVQIRNRFWLTFTVILLWARIKTSFIGII